VGTIREHRSGFSFPRSRHAQDLSAWARKEDRWRRVLRNPTDSRNCQGTTCIPDYLVFPDQLRTVRQGGPFAELALSSDRADSISGGSVVSVSRNGKEIWRGRFLGAPPQPLELTLVKSANDVVEWKIQDAAGKVTHRGQVAFPVAGAVPHTVEYLIAVDNHPVLPNAAKPSTVGATGRPAPRESNLQVAASVQEKKLIHRVEPVYPALAKQARIQGDVQFKATIAKDGSVKQLTLIQGSPLLSSAASEAVKQWIYQATIANGQPLEVDTQITVSFKLDQPN
jgi:TonB family protein